MSRENVSRLIWQSVLLMLLDIQLICAISDFNISNNQASVLVNVTNTSSLHITVIPVKSSDDFLDSIIKHTYDDIPGELSFLQKMYPLQDNLYPINQNGLYYNTTGVLIPEQPRFRTLNYHDVMDQLEEGQVLSSSTNHLVVGVVDSAFILEHGGVHSSRAPHVVLVDGTKQVTIAHEVGHYFQLCDEVVCRGNDCDEEDSFTREASQSETGCPNHDANKDGILDYPCTDNGCPVPNSDLISLLNITGHQYSNYRSIEGRVGGMPDETWIDNESYTLIEDALLQHSQLQFYVGPTYAIRIYLSKTSAPQIKSIFTIFGGFLTPQNNLSGDYRVTLSNSSVTTQQYLLAPTYYDRFLNGSLQEINDTYIILVVPADNSSVLTILLNGTVADTRNKSANNPSIFLATNTSNKTYTTPFSISWNATDADNDTLTYATLISADNGSTWVTLNFEYNQTAVVIDNANFPYSNQYKLKILVSDGFNTGVVISNGTFTIIPPPKISVDDITTLKSIEESNVFEVTIKNDGGQNLSYVAWQFISGNENITSNSTSTMATNEITTILIEYNYSFGGAKNVSFFAFDNNMSVNSTFTKDIFIGGMRIGNLSVVSQNGTQLRFNFTIYNNGSANLSNINWTLNTGVSNISSMTVMNLSAYQGIILSVPYNYSDSGTYIVQASVWTTFSNYTTVQDLQILDVDIPEYQILRKQDTAVIYSFTITNQLDKTMGNVSWRFGTGETNISNNTSLSSAESVSAIIEYAYSTYGTLLATVNATDGTHSNRRSTQISISELIISNLQLLSTNATKAVIGYDVGNLFTTNKTMTWSFDTNDTGIISAQQPLTIVSGENASIIIENNYTTGTKTIIAKANTSNANYSATMNITLS